DLGVSEDIVNVNGGAIAMGHPIGASGARIALHLVNELRRRGGGLGAAALCGGGGQGDALLFSVPAEEGPKRSSSDEGEGHKLSPCSVRTRQHRGVPMHAPQVVERVRALVDRVRAGDRRALARAITLVENGSEELVEVMAGLAPYTGNARVVGLTGSPGVGKSTTTGAIVRAVRDKGLTVAVLAIDPSSPFTGGALLGDRVRMQEHATDTGVFIRSMANRGHLGGLSWATPHALRVLDAAGFDVILVETVGVGQAEVEIAGHADTTVVLSAPGLGDAVQAAKAGVLEIADVLVVNKADRDGARVTLRELRQMVAMKDRDDHEWKPPIVMTVAAQGEGI